MSDKKQMIGKMLGESMTLEDVKELNKLPIIGNMKLEGDA
jgi:hypothetical protein